MREASIEKSVCRYAKGLGVLAIKFSPMGRRGWPDRIFLYKGRVLFIEFKAPGKKATPLQANAMEKLKAEGFDVFLADNARDGKKLIDIFVAGG